MPGFALFFVAGAWVLQQFAILPALAWGWCCIPFAVLAWCCRRLPWLFCAALAGLGFASGFVWALLLAHARMQDALPAEWQGRDIEIIGVISSLPVRHERGVRYTVDVEQVLTPGAVVPRHISLQHYSQGFQAPAQHIAPQDSSAAFNATDSSSSQQDASSRAAHSQVSHGQNTERRPSQDHAVAEFHAGERWQLVVRLKRPHGNLNPHGMDIELWLLERNIRATGYIRPAPVPVRLSVRVNQPAYWVDIAREYFSQRINTVLDGKAYAGVIKALVIGEADAVNQSDWQIFRATGIVHLVSISGLHITMLAAMLYGLVHVLWRRVPRLTLYWPARKAALLAGVVTALIYALLAGFSVPTQRTLYMLSIFALAFWSGRQINFARILSMALLVVVLLDPWAVLASGFWLSFGAVGLIAYVMGGRLQKPLWWRDAWQTQWAVTVGLMPLLILLFRQVSLVSPLANAWAIPLFSLLVVPLALLGSFLPLDWPLLLAHSILQLAMQLLTWMAAWPIALWLRPVPSMPVLFLALVGMLCLLLPRGFPLRYLGWLGLLPLFLLPAARPSPGDMRVTVLDVGQGEAVVIETARHTLVYDTGPRYSSDSDAASSVILPYLQGQGISRVDGLIVSHDDLDHSGGMASLLKGLKVAWVLSSLSADKFASELRGVQHQACLAGTAWHWDGVSFRLLYPADAASLSPTIKSNNRSCVLRVQSAAGSLLIPGDIERSAEQDLLQQYPAQGQLPNILSSDVLLAPHHGSLTSSTQAFVNAVKPHIVVFPVGYRNRFKHPRPEVVQRYIAAGAQAYRSDNDGAVILEYRQHKAIEVTRWRGKQQRYWHDAAEVL